jgi:L-threonylcarbamoyladenylate synthase
MKKTDLSNAIKALKNGEIIVYPTDTLYAIGADIYNIDAVKNVFKIKKRPYSCPFSVAVANFDEIDKISYTNDLIKRVVKRFLPGSLTLILNKKDTISSIITGGLDKIAVRIPKNDIALNLLSKFGPLTATSANIHDKKTPYVVNDLKMQFSGKISLYIDAGRLDEKPSTIVDLTTEKPIIIRKGPIKKEEILEMI